MHPDRADYPARFSIENLDLSGLQLKYKQSGHQRCENPGGEKHSGRSSRKNSRSDLEHGVRVQSGGLVTIRHVGLLVSTRSECCRADRAGGVGSTASARSARAGLHLVSSSISSTTRLAASAATVSAGHAEQGTQTATAARARRENQETQSEGSVTLHDRTFRERGLVEGDGTSGDVRLCPEASANRVELANGDPERISQERGDTRRVGASEVLPGPREPRIELEGKYEESEKRVKMSLLSADEDGKSYKHNNQQRRKSLIQKTLHHGTRCWQHAPTPRKQKFSRSPR